MIQKVVELSVFKIKDHKKVRIEFTPTFGGTTIMTREKQRGKFLFKNF